MRLSLAATALTVALLGAAASGVKWTKRVNASAAAAARAAPGAVAGWSLTSGPRRSRDPCMWAAAGSGCHCRS
jgi:hypothetical protein